MVTRWTRARPAPAVDAVVDRVEVQAVKDPLVKLFVWLVDWPREMVVDWKAMVETVIRPVFSVDPVKVETVMVEPVRVEKAAWFILMEDPMVIDEALTVGKE
jgi:hypothetical protein